MASVGDELRQAARARVLAMAPGERLALAGRLADADVELYCAAHGTTREQARRAFMRQRQAGRRPSRLMQEPAE
jgi:hypothetical protein